MEETKGFDKPDHVKKSVPMLNKSNLFLWEKKLFRYSASAHVEALLKYKIHTPIKIDILNPTRTLPKDNEVLRLLDKASLPIQNSLALHIPDRLFDKLSAAVQVPNHNIQVYSEHTDDTPDDFLPFIISGSVVVVNEDVYCIGTDSKLLMKLRLWISGNTQKLSLVLESCIPSTIHYIIEDHTDVYQMINSIKDYMGVPKAQLVRDFRIQLQEVSFEDLESYLLKYKQLLLKHNESGLTDETDLKEYFVSLLPLDKYHQLITTLAPNESFQEWLTKVHQFILTYQRRGMGAFNTNNALEGLPLAGVNVLKGKNKNKFKNKKSNQFDYKELKPGTFKSSRWGKDVTDLMAAQCSICCGGGHGAGVCPSREPVCQRCFLPSKGHVCPIVVTRTLKGAKVNLTSTALDLFPECDAPSRASSVVDEEPNSISDFDAFLSEEGIRTGNISMVGAILVDDSCSEGDSSVLKSSNSSLDTSDVDSASQPLQSVDVLQTHVSSSSKTKCTCEFGYDCLQIVVDSGATIHITGDSSLLSNVVDSSLMKIEVADGKESFSSQSGVLDINISSGVDISFQDVRYCSDIKSTLLSTRQLAQQGVFSVCLSNETLLVNGKNKQVLGRAIWNGVAYILHGVNTSHDSEKAVLLNTNVGRSHKLLSDMSPDMLAQALQFNEADVAHCIFGHCGLESLKRINRKFKGDLRFCVGCSLAPFSRKPLGSGVKDVRKDNLQVEAKVDKIDVSALSPLSGSIAVDRILAKVCVDLMGPFPSSSRGHKYCLCIYDVFSQYGDVFTFANKSDASNRLILWVRKMKMVVDMPILSLRSDKGREFLNQNVLNFLETEGIVYELSNSYVHQENGYVERYNQLILGSMRKMMFHSHLGSTYWDFAAMYSSKIWNVIPRYGQTITPYEKMFQKSMDVSRFHIFGAFGHYRSSADSKYKVNRSVVFLGVSNSPKGYYIYDKITGVLKEARDAKFDDIGFLIRHYLRFLDDGLVDSHRDLHLSNDCFVSENDSVNNFEFIDFNTTVLNGSSDTNKIVDLSSNVPESSQSQGGYVELGDVNSGNESNENENNLELNNSQILNEDSFHDSFGVIEPIDDELWGIMNESTTQTLRRSTRIRRPPYDEVTGLALSLQQIFSAKLTLVPPTSYASIAGRADEALWLSAYYKELEYLMRIGQMQVVDRPKNVAIIPLLELFTIKIDNITFEEIFKCRFVARGDLQPVKSNNFFSPVASCVAGRIFLMLSMNFSEPPCQLDVTAAFLNGRLKKAIYLELPKGHKEYSKTRSRVWKTTTSIYGLIQAPLRWFEKITEVFEKLNLIALTGEDCLFRRFDSSGKIELLVLLYVDDILVSGESKCKKEFIEVLSKEFTIKTKQIAEKFTGLSFSFRMFPSFISVSQSDYIEKGISKFNLNDASIPDCPLPSGNLDFALGKDLIDGRAYQSIIGFINYIAVNSRPDVAFTVSHLSQLNSKPTVAAFKAAKRTLLYLYGTKSYCLRLFKLKKNEVNIKCYVDSSYGNGFKRKSICGYLIYIDTSLIVYKSKQQSLVALSSTESEYVAAVLAIKEILWLKGIFSELNISVKSSTLLIDNQATIKILNNRGSTSRTKHIDIRLQRAKQHVLSKEIETLYVKSELNLADFLTKRIGGPRLKMMCSSILFKADCSGYISEKRISAFLTQGFVYKEKKGNSPHETPIEIVLNFKEYLLKYNRNIFDSPWLELGSGLGAFAHIWPASSLCIDIENEFVTICQNKFKHCKWLCLDIFSDSFVSLKKDFKYCFINPPFELGVSFIITACNSVRDRVGIVFALLPVDFFDSSDARKEILRKEKIKYKKLYNLGRVGYYSHDRKLLKAGDDGMFILTRQK